MGCEASKRSVYSLHCDRHQSWILKGHFTTIDGVALNMPGKVKVRVLSGRQLPVMDRASDTTDAFAEVKLGDTTFKTEVCRYTYA